MAHEFAQKFYNSKHWKKVRAAYLSEKNYICERCGAPANIVHHKTYITPQNINDTHVTLSFDNLEALCFDCHNKEHFKQQAEQRYIFGSNGKVILLPPKK